MGGGREGCFLINNMTSNTAPSKSYYTAFIIYQPQAKMAKRRIFFDEKAGRILSMSIEMKDKTDFSHKVMDLCSRWKELLDKGWDDLKEAGQDRISSGYIDILRSHRRQYAVRGIVLSLQPAAARQQAKKQYLFMLERFKPDDLNFSQVFRTMNLNNREKDIVMLLLKDRSNKEMADILNLSVNTIKGYLKILMRKLGVNSRAGIVAVFLTGK